MPTVEEVLKATGLTDEQIKALDPKVMTGITQVVSTATQTLEAAELAKRAQQEMYDKEVAPALDKWANESTNLTAERDYYKTLAMKAKEGGFIPAAEPFTPPNPQRDPQSGKFVAGANPVPGSPDLVKEIRRDAAQGILAVSDLDWKYRSLYGQPMPDSPSTLVAEANAQRMDLVAYAAKKYDFPGKEKALAEQKQKEHDDAIVKKAIEENDKKWSEKIGSNPNIRQATESRFSELQKGVTDKTRVDPLTVSKEQRHANTQRIIQKDLRESATVQ